MKLSELLKIYEQDYDYHIDFLVLPQGEGLGNEVFGYCTEAYVRDLYVIEYLVNHFDLESIFKEDKDKFVLLDAIGSVNIEKAKINDFKLSLYKMGLNIQKGNRMLRNVHRLYSNEPINIVEDNIINNWNKIVKNCCGNSSIRGSKYRGGDVIVGGFRPIHYTRIQETYPNVIQETLQIENPILRAILLHYVTAFYHPFCDGNGRLSRFLMRNELVKYNKGLGILPFDYYLYYDVNTYYSLFKSVVKSSAVDCFISYFCKLFKYVLIHKLIEKGEIEVDEKYKDTISFIKDEGKTFIVNMSMIEKESKLIGLAKNMKELSTIGYIFEDSYFYYVIKDGNL